MKKLIPALCMLLVAATLLGTSTYAWFSMNTQVQATGMTVNAKAPASLVITNTSNVAASSSPSVALSTAGSDLTPASHGDHATYSSGLYYNTTPTSIDGVTGLGTVTPATAINNTPTGSNYYVDYVVYISSPGEALEDKELTVAISTTETIATTVNAVSVDFYVVETGGTAAVNATNYKGTLNLAGKDAAVNDGSTAKTSLVLGTYDFAKNTVDAVTVLMRVYFDGALLEDASTAYVNSTAYTTANIKFDAAFTIPAES